MYAAPDHAPENAKKLLARCSFSCYNANERAPKRDKAKRKTGAAPRSRQPGSIRKAADCPARHKRQMENPVHKRTNGKETEK